MRDIHYENYMYDPILAAVCLNCKRKDCDGICNDFRDAFRQFIGVPRKPRGHNIVGPDGLGIWQDIEAFGERHTLREWSALTGISYTTLRNRVIRCGWPIERALGKRPQPQRMRTEIEVDGRSMTVMEWALELGIGYSTIYKYIKRFGSKEDAIRHFMAIKEGKK